MNKGHPTVVVLGHLQATLLSSVSPPLPHKQHHILSFLHTTSCSLLSPFRPTGVLKTNLHALEGWGFQSFSKLNGWRSFRNPADPKSALRGCTCS